jgi:hypothetical protein
MQRIRKQFGAKFADALAKCPTLVADLKAIRAAGVKIRKVGGHCQAYSMLARLTIYIGSRCGLSYKLVSLAHEKVHMLDSPTPSPTPGKTGRKAFIEMCLGSEVDAIVHEVQVVAELLAAGIHVDDHSMKWYRLHKKGGRAAIRKAIEEAVTSNTGEKYPEYYGGWYDDALKPKDRLPFHTLKGGDRRVTAAWVQHPARARDGRDICPRFCISCSPPTDPPEELDISVKIPGKKSSR